MTDLEKLIKDIRSCKICTEHLPFEPNPVIKIQKEASVSIIGQAPGRQAHLKTLNWDDQSGNRLRQWLQVTKEQFYSDRHFALMSMGFCFPGTHTKGGDLCPRPECAPTWHAQILKLLPNIKAILLVGRYAQQYYLPLYRQLTLTELVKAWTIDDQRFNFSSSGYKYIPLPHPSWRSTVWINNNPWFKQYTLPKLNKEITAVLT